MRPKWGGAALGLLLVVADLATPAHGSGWHGWPGFGLIYGLVACVTIVVVSKALGKAGIQRSEDFYDEPGAGPSA